MEEVVSDDLLTSGVVTWATVTRTSFSATGSSSSLATCTVTRTVSPNCRWVCPSSKLSVTNSWLAALENPTINWAAVVSSESNLSSRSPVHAHTVTSASVTCNCNAVTSPAASVVSSPVSTSHAARPMLPTCPTADALHVPSSRNALSGSVERNTSTDVSTNGWNMASRTDTISCTLDSPSTESFSACMDTPAGRATVCANARVMNAAICARVTLRPGPN